MLGFNSLTSMFDNALNYMIGSSFDDFFSNPTPFINGNYSFEKTLQKNGHEVQIKGVVDKNGDLKRSYYLDGKPVEDLKDIDWAMKDLEALSPKRFWPKVLEPKGCNNKLPKELVRGTNLPYMDMIHTVNGDLLLKFAMAGVPEKAIGLSTESDYLIVEVKAQKNTVSEEKPKYVYLQKGIQSVDEDLYKKVFIDPAKYNIDTLHWDYKDGMLKVHVKKIDKPETHKRVFKPIKD